MDMFFHKVDQQVMDNGWRNTIYERLDGTQFHVAIPATDLIIQGELKKRTYNEHNEMKTALIMYGVNKKEETQ